VTIRRGEDWGTRGPVPADAVEVYSNAALFELVNGAPPWPPVWLRGGDLARTLGVPTAERRAAPDEPGPGDALIVQVDLGQADHDGGTHTFAAHAVLRRSWWRGPVLAVANAQFLGRWDIAPRGHPNDGWLDVTEVAETMTVRQRWLAGRRLPTAGHLPHPHVSSGRTSAKAWTLDRPGDLWLDGQRVGRTTHLAVRVLDNALTVLAGP
jgi:hypothetical protein